MKKLSRISYQHSAGIDLRMKSSLLIQFRAQMRRPTSARSFSPEDSLLLHHSQLFPNCLESPKGL